MLRHTGFFQTVLALPNIDAYTYFPRAMSSGCKQCSVVISNNSLLPLTSRVCAVDITGEGMRRYTLDFERHIAITNSANDAVSVRLAWAAVNPSITYPASMESSLRGAIGYTTGQSGLIYAIGYKFRV